MEAKTVYQVRDWDRHFENFKSRTVDRCGYVCTPNKQHGEGLTYILSLNDGLSIYGVFNLILGACSQHGKPREGWLTNDGTAQGKPWTASSLSIRWRQTVQVVVRALEVLSSSEVGWLIAHPVSEAGYQTDTAVSGNGMELKGKEGKGKQVSTPVSSEPDVPASEPFAEFPVVGRGSKAWLLTVAYVAELAGDFPNLDVPQQCRSARAWALANPSKRKTAKGMPRFLVNWMNEAVRRGQTSGQNGAGGSYDSPEVQAKRVADRFRAQKASL